jgi:putative membrane protein
MRVADIFDEAGRKRVEDAVRAAESKTLSEIVPVVARRSSRYARAEDAIAVACGLLAFLVLGLSHESHEVEVFQGLAAMLVAIAFGAAVVARYDPLVRALAGKVEMRFRVEEQALRQFRTFGVGLTRSRRGVLIYLSLFEHMVVVLEDDSVSAALPPQSAAKIRDAVIARMKEGRPVDALVEAIGVAGEMLATVFPRPADDINELADALRVIE